MERLGRYWETYQECNTEKQRLKKYRRQLRDREGELKGFNIQTITITEENGGSGREALFEEIIAENSPELKTDLYQSS